MMIDVASPVRLNRVLLTMLLVMVWLATLTMSASTFAALAEIDSVGGLSGPIAMATSPMRDHIYVASTTGNVVSAFARNSFNGQVRLIKNYVDGVDGVSGIKLVSDVAVSNDGGFVYAVSRLNGAITVFQRDAAGLLTWVSSKTGADLGVPALARASHIILSPDGKYAYVASVNGVADGADVLLAFARDGSTGQLSFVEAYKEGDVAAQGLRDIKTLAWNSDATQLYATSGQDNAVTLWRRDVATGRLTLEQIVIDGVATQNAMTGPAGLAISSDGAFVYVAGGASNSVAVFARAADGKMSFVSAVRNGVESLTGLDAPLALALSPSSERLYVSSVKSKQVVVFTRNATTGALTYAERLLDTAPNRHLDTVNALFALDSGAALYALSAAGNALSVWANPAVDLTLVANGQISASVGEVVEYSLTASNVGNAAATHVAVDATWPDGVDVSVVDIGELPAGTTSKHIELKSLSPNDGAAAKVQVKFLREGVKHAVLRIAAAEPDANAADNEATLEVQVLPNHAPIAVNDAAQTPTNTPVDILVLYNDHDDDAGDTVTIATDVTEAISQRNGAVVVKLGGDGKQYMHYVPPVGFTGKDSFTYSIRDNAGALSAANVTINVGAATIAGTGDGGNAPGTGSSGGGGSGGGGMMPWEIAGVLTLWFAFAAGGRRRR